MSASLWNRYCASIIRYEDLGISLDVSRMNYPDGYFETMGAASERAMAAMAELEAGAVANPDEGRMVGHYWLRTPSLAPDAGIREEIVRDIASAKEFAAAVHAGEVGPVAGGKFKRLLVIGIGGSALGPQLVADCLVDGWQAAMQTSFFDNTDPDGIQRVLGGIGGAIAETLTVVISKSGGTPETRNGMIEVQRAFTAKAYYERHGLDFAKHAVAVTGTAAGGIKSKLEAYALEHGWLRIFPMTDWVGGRTSVMSTVGLVPAALQGVDVDALLAGAAAMDAKTRTLPAGENLSMRLALMWHHATGGRGAKDMVVLPYKDRLVLMSKYLQQLVMESLGKEHDLEGKTVHQGIAVYGNKGSTDQHAYVQQLRDGVNNFFATFIEVREGGGVPLEVEPGVTPADYLQGFLRGTRQALHDSGRENMTISIARVDAFSLGMLIAAFERAVGFYATLVGINAYHQPGVEAGKKAAADFLAKLAAVKAGLSAVPQTAEAIGAGAGLEAEDVHHALNHLAANLPGVQRTAGASPAEDCYWRE